MKPELIAKLCALLGKGTPRPWGQADKVNPHMITYGKDGRDSEGKFLYAMEAWQEDEDAELAVAACNALPELLDENGRLTYELRGSLAECHEVEQALAKALGGYPELYPQVSKVDDGTLCIGLHTPGTIAQEAASKIRELKAIIEQLKRGERLEMPQEVLATICCALGSLRNNVVAMRSAHLSRAEIERAAAWLPEPNDCCAAFQWKKARKEVSDEDEADSNGAGKASSGS